PTLVLTAVLDGLGSHADPAIYAAPAPAPLLDNQPLRYLASLFLLNRSWIFPVDMSHGTDAPFWSLALEGTYYVVFGLFLTRRPVIAAVLALGVFALTGPFTLALFPL